MGELRLFFFMKLIGIDPNYIPEPILSEVRILPSLLEGVLDIFISLMIWDLTVGSFPISDKVLTK